MLTKASVADLDPPCTVCQLFLLFSFLLPRCGGSQETVSTSGCWECPHPVICWECPHPVVECPHAVVECPHPVVDSVYIRLLTVSTSGCWECPHPVVESVKNIRLLRTFTSGCWVSTSGYYLHQRLHSYSSLWLGVTVSVLCCVLPLLKAKNWHHIFRRTYSVLIQLSITLLEEKISSHYQTGRLRSRGQSSLQIACLCSLHNFGYRQEQYRYRTSSNIFSYILLYRPEITVTDLR